MDSPDIDIDAVLASNPPLSSLPTPPSLRPSRFPATEGNHATFSTTATIHPPSPLSKAADHFISLLPSNTHGFHAPDPTVIIAYLERVYLPNEYLGLTACILGNITNSFARSWQIELTRAGAGPKRPECVVLAAMCIAASYLSDTRSSVERWLRYGFRQITHTAIWPSAREFSTTVRCVLREIDWEIHAFTPAMVAEAAEELRTGRPVSSYSSSEMSSLIRSTAPSTICPLPVGWQPAPDAASSRVHMRGGGDWEGAIHTAASEFCLPMLASTQIHLPSRKSEVEKDLGRRDNGYSGVAVWAQGVVTPEPTPPIGADAEKTLGPRFLRLL